MERPENLNRDRILDELLADPIIQLVMRKDRLSDAEFRRTLDRARRDSAKLEQVSSNVSAPIIP